MSRDPALPISVVWSPDYEVDIGPHVFPTRKYRRVKERLLAEGVLTEASFLAPAPASEEDLARVHSDTYLEKIRRGSFSAAEERILELPFSAELRTASVLCAGGTTMTARIALEDGASVHLGGGFHHAFTGHGEGFCLLNDVAVAARTLHAGGGVKRTLIVDLDVHHGNGTAEIFRDDPTVFTFSMHEERNYPVVKPPGDLDLGLDRGTGDAAYLGLLERHLQKVLDAHEFDLLLYLAGADPYEGDQLGGLGLSKEGLRRRDAEVLGQARMRGVPVAVVLAGGYAFDEEDTVEIHRNTVIEAIRARSARHHERNA